MQTPAVAPLALQGGQTADTGCRWARADAVCTGDLGGGIPELDAENRGVGLGPRSSVVGPGTLNSVTENTSTPSQGLFCGRLGSICSIWIQKELMLNHSAFLTPVGH